MNTTFVAEGSPETEEEESGGEDVRGRAEEFGGGAEEVAEGAEEVAGGDYRGEEQHECTEEVEAAEETMVGSSGGEKGWALGAVGAAVIAGSGAVVGATIVAGSLLFLSNSWGRRFDSANASWGSRFHSVDRRVGTTMDAAAKAWMEPQKKNEPQKNEPQKK